MRHPTPVSSASSPAFRPSILSTAIGALLALGAHPGVALAQDAAPAAPNAAEAPKPKAASDDTQSVVVSTGARGGRVTLTESPSPIDVISGDQLTATGKSSLREVLGTLMPSFTAAAQPGGGTSASIRPAKIRGLSGDSLLVLVNGKRRHNTAVYNNFGTGSVPVDLDLIPIAAIDHIEVLRDGASAQYGSDAIAGVLNIILKRDASGGSSATTFGQQDDKPGDLFQQSFNFGKGLGDSGGFIHVAFDSRLQGPSYAAGDAQGSLYYPLLNGQPVPYGTPGATPDPRDATADRQINHGYGRSNRDRVLSTSYNAELPVSDQLTLYSFSTFARRDIVDSRGNFRPNSVSSLPEVYPDGFAAQRTIAEPDYQVAVGGKGLVGEWDWDLSTTYANDRAKLGARNTVNSSIGPSSPTVFYLGSLQFKQATTNVDLTRGFDLGLAEPTQVSWGAEHRWEKYIETAGDPDSYRDGGYVYPVGHPRAGQRPPAGLQSFVGTSAGDAGSKERNVVATYIDVGGKVTPKLYLGTAARYERYDDSSGSTASGKLASRYEFTKGFAARATISNGFRAPSLAQQIFSVTQQTGARQADGTTQSLLAQYLPPDSDLARSLGAKPLTPEKSTNYSAGFTLELDRTTRLTVDAYQINVRDLIVKGENLVDTAGSTLVRDRLASLGYSNLYAAQYNTNAADVKVRGLDIASETTHNYRGWGSVRWSALYSYNRIKITRVADNPPELNFLGSNYVVFGRVAQQQLTESTPKDKLVLGANWKVSDFTTNLRVTRYGKYKEPGATVALDRYFTPKWITDLDVSYKVTKELSVALGANNVFNIRPDRQPVAASTTGLGAANPTQSDATYNYGSFSPFGVNGGFYYARVNYDF